MRCVPLVGLAFVDPLPNRPMTSFLAAPQFRPLVDYYLRVSKLNILHPS